MIEPNLSTGAAVGITFTLTLLVTLPVGVAIGLCLSRCRCGQKRKATDEYEDGAIYEEPPAVAMAVYNNQAYETSITVTSNKAYGKINRR